MDARLRCAALLTTGTLLLAGCASTPAGTDSRPPSPSTGIAMSPGMVMPDGSTMGAETTRSGSQTSGTDIADGPTAAEQMICAAETRSDITQVLGLATAPTSSSHWADRLYTCTYALPMGTLVVSVKQSASSAEAMSFFAQSRNVLGASRTLAGLGQGSYGTTDGKVVLIKDSDVLTVDATKLPPVFGAQQSKRFDFAYEIASDILGCWTE